MKSLKINIYKLTLLGGIFLSVLGLNSCSTELDINEDPNNPSPSEVPLRTILSAAEVNLGYTLGGEGTRMPANIMQHYAGHRNQPYDYSIYNISSSSTDGLWTNLYDVLMDLKAIEDRGHATNDKIYVGVSQLLQAYTFSVTTDIFGDIPFSEALQGSSNITPKYDTQESIYPKLISLIDAGIANVQSNTGSYKPTSDDFIYGGNVTKWVKFGNSLKLRLYNHLSKRDPNAATNFLATNPQLIDDYSVNAKVPFYTSATNSNPIYQFDVLSGRKDNAVASTIVDKMKSLNDPRINVYFTTVANDGAGYKGQVRGNIPGDGIDDSGENLYSRVGTAFASADSPVMLISASEVNFIKAEVYKRAGNDANAKISYESAIAQDFNALGLSSSFASYLANTSVAYNSTLQRIMEQKWITMYQASFESWVDWRRTGYPSLSLPLINRTSGVIPRRLPYPQIEINVNGKSLSAGPGIPVPFENMKTKMWWDQ